MPTFEELLTKLDNTSDKSNEAVCLRQTINDLRYVDISDDDIKEALRRPSDFGYFDNNDEMFVTWSLGPVFRTRDSDTLEESNADALERALEEATEQGLFSDDDWYVTGCNHWAVGWVDHLSFRAIESVESRTPTTVFLWLKHWFDALSEYPIADEEDYSRRKWEYAVEYIADAIKVRHDAPDDWANQVASEMDELPRDNYGNDDEIERVARELGFLACKECDGDGWVYDFEQKIEIPVDPNGNWRSRQGFTYAKVECEECKGTGVASNETR